MTWFVATENWTCERQPADTKAILHPRRPRPFQTKETVALAEQLLASSSFPRGSQL